MENVDYTPKSIGQRLPRTPFIISTLRTVERIPESMIIFPHHRKIIDIKYSKPMETRVVSIRVSDLRAIYNSLEEWLKHPNHVYIGRKSPHIKGSINSKWLNPFPVPQYTREQSIRLYEEYIRTKRLDLMVSLGELEGKVLGCWCHPLPCHGDVLVKLLEEGKGFYS